MSSKYKSISFQLLGKRYEEDLQVSYGSHVRGGGWNKSSSIKYDIFFFDNLSPS
jgi:hypothetical protein